MVNPTHRFAPGTNAFEDARYLRVPLHETASGDFVSAAPGSPLPIMLIGDGGTPVTTRSTSYGTVALDIYPADIQHQVVNADMHQYNEATTTIATATVGDGTERTLTVASAVGFAVGDSIHINTGLAELTYPTIISIAGNVLTLDRYIDFAHAIGDEVTKTTLNMALQVGTLETPQEYWVEPPDGQVWHITRLLFEMTHGTAGDLGKFGGITALTNGVLLRAKINGQYGTFTNWKTNGNLKTDMFDVEFDSRSGGGGSYGTSGRGTFTNAGAVIRLDGDTNDRIELYVQDDLTDLDSFTMKMQGHTEVQ